ncbi:MAG: hypothetical protein GX058_06130 [Firmicutes bacterium]|nr:hypothetical protein [Bacillota bacterium]
MGRAVSKYHPSNSPVQVPISAAGATRLLVAAGPLTVPPTVPQPAIPPPP